MVQLIMQWWIFSQHSRKSPLCLGYWNLDLYRGPWIL